MKCEIVVAKGLLPLYGGAQAPHLGGEVDLALHFVLGEEALALVVVEGADDLEVTDERCALARFPRIIQLAQAYEDGNEIPRRVIAHA